MSIASDLEHLESERQRVALLRTNAEPDDAQPNKDDYIIIAGKYRVVTPYHFDFMFGVRERHHNRNIIDIFTQEFPARSRDYYLHAFRTGLLTVENMPTAGADTLLAAGTRCRHLVHRHEPPVAATPIEIVGSTPKYIAVNKPASMPVHVAGQYRKNTVLGVLSAERPELLPLLPVHRLDKPVSGVLIFARDAVSADILRLEIADKGAVRKMYVARVAGKFPFSSTADAPVPVPVAGGGGGGHMTSGKGDIILVDVPLAFDTKLNHAIPMPNLLEPSVKEEDAGDGDSGGAVHAAVDAAVLGDEKRKFETVMQPSGTPIPRADAEAEIEDRNQIEDIGEENQESKRSKKRKLKLKKKNKLSKAERIAAVEASRAAAATRAPQARPAATEFRLLAIAPDGLTSLVECRPLTGRSHQLRAHLAWLGHPIANDLQYGGKYDGPTSARLLAKDLGISWHDNPESGAGIVNPATIKTIKDGAGGGGGGDAMNNIDNICLDFECPTEYHDPYCPHCPFYGPKDFPTDVRPLWLHAHRYENTRKSSIDGKSEWVFEAPLPEWANAEWVPPLSTPLPPS